MGDVRAIACWIALFVACLASPGAWGTVVLRALDPAHATADIARVLDGELDPQFHPVGQAWLLLPPSDAPRWFRIDPSDALGGERRVLTFTRVPIRDLRVYLPDEAGGWREQAASFFASSAAGYAPHAYYFPLDANAARAPIYVRIVHGGRLYLSVDILSERAFQQAERRWVVAITAAITALAVMLLMNLVFWLQLREAMYLTYVAFIGGLMGWSLFATGLVNQWWPQVGQWRVPASPSGLLVAVSMALMLRFVGQFVDLSRTDPAGDRVVRWLAIGFAMLAATYLVPGAAESRAVAYAGSMVFAAMPPVLLLVLLRSGRRGSRAAWLFLVAWLPLGVVSAQRTLAGFGVLPATPLTLLGPLGAVAFESVVLAIGLAGHALELRLQRDRALRLAQIDPLTGALNRRAGEAKLQEMFDAAKARGVSLSLMFLDMDRLKRINDTFSHDAGDLCLRVLVGRVQSLMPPRAEMVRWGGDEFVLLLPGLFGADADVLADRVRDALESSPVPFDGEALWISASFGVSCVDETVASPQELVRRADIALYAQRRSSRDGAVLADAGT